MTQASPKRNRLLPWYIGIAIIAAVVFYIGYQMATNSCPEPAILDVAVLVVIPVVYLTLMYLTFTSQE